jgi:hypothetical protein
LNDSHESRREFGGALVAVVVAVVGCAVFAGIWIGFWATLIVTVGLALVGIAAVIWWGTRRPHAPTADAPHVQPVDDGRFRILVVADESSTSPAFIDELRSHAGGRPISLFVMAPALQSRIGLVAGDQEGYDSAARHLEATIKALEDAGLPAQGEVGPADPLQAADDGLRQFPANEIVFVTHAEGKTNWLEDGVVAMAESRYFQPVTQLTVARG